MEPNIIPAHLAIIMDGNGRWAKKHSLSRSEGHKKGADAVEPLMDVALDLGIKAVSLYAFSTENWLRPAAEVKGLWKLIEYFFKEKLDMIKSKGIQITHSGTTKRLPPTTKKTISRAVEATKENKKLILNFCINYGGRQEIVEAVNTWVGSRKTNEKLSLKKLEKNLYTANMPEVDLMIRTSGEYRISNFLIWQMAYAELIFVDELWPDFTPEHLYKAIHEYQQRERRFGGL
ncbi:MAG: di-trans,poly-cis-decaprenylcistransferase [bacterium]|nr:di-trans,poly-cis-decaprenylcistransferase [bacterium]